MYEALAARDVALRDAITGLILELSGYAHGHGERRVAHALRAGWPVNRKLVLRISCHETPLRQSQRRFSVVMTDASHGYQTYPNYLADLVLTTSDQALVVNISPVLACPRRLALWPAFWMFTPAAVWLEARAPDHHYADSCGPGDGAHRASSLARAHPPLRP
ncbi:MAG TPA: hypothetical protein VFQ25_16210 [Ktedonobacterales bacterium]|nr:hypothetical protein [Ktedonobacterales bacterium]